MNKMIFGLIALSPLTSFAEKVCFNEAAEPAYRYTVKRMRGSPEVRFEGIAKAVKNIEYISSYDNEVSFNVTIRGTQPSESPDRTLRVDYEVGLVLNHTTCAFLRFRKI